MKKEVRKSLPVSSDLSSLQDKRKNAQGVNEINFKNSAVILLQQEILTPEQLCR